MITGLETLFHAFKNDVNSDADVLFLFVHWYLVKNEFVCVVDGKKTEILPKDWNSADENVYAVCYSHASKGYELKVLKVEDSLVINLMKKSSEQTANVTCHLKNHVSSYKNAFQDIFINVQDLYEQLDKEMSPLFRAAQEASKTATESNTTKDATEKRQRDDPLRVQSHQPIPSASIGRSDLDPFGFDPSGSGGMIFDPFRNMDRRFVAPNLPRGAVPPGARFDPFGPPNPDDLMPGSSSRVGPNRSNFPPPQFDDRFM